MTSTPLLYPAPPGIRFMFRYQQQSPTWRVPAADPIQWGSGYIIVGIQPGVPVTRVKFTPIILNWYTTSGGRLLPYDHPVPYTAP